MSYSVANSNGTYTYIEKRDKEKMTWEFACSIWVLKNILKYEKQFTVSMCGGRSVLMSRRHWPLFWHWFYVSRLCSFFSSLPLCFVPKYTPYRSMKQALNSWKAKRTWATNQNGPILNKYLVINLLGRGFCQGFSNLLQLKFSDYLIGISEDNKKVKFSSFLKV